MGFACWLAGLRDDEDSWRIGIGGRGRVDEGSFSRCDKRRRVRRSMLQGVVWLWCLEDRVRDVLTTKSWKRLGESVVHCVEIWKGSVEIYFPG